MIHKGVDFIMANPMQYYLGWHRKKPQWRVGWGWPVLRSDNIEA